jgi:two-component system cell cycle sensor histidine kinase/response regulator CckA
VEVPSDHEILLALGDDVPAGIWVARVPNGEVVYANRTYSEVLAITAHNLVTRDGKPYPETKLPFARALAERRVVIADDLAVVRGDGRKIDVRAVARPVGNPLSHIVVSFFDVSREVAAEKARADSEQRLRRAQRLEAIGTLAGGIAHDFNNLIFSVKLLAADLAANTADGKVREVMGEIDQITDRSALLTRALLSFARRTKPRTTTVNVNDVVTAMAELLGRTLSGLELGVEVEASDRGAVVGDQAQLEQLVMSLVLNARDAVHSEGRVVVRTSDRADDSPAGRAIVLEVADNGPGVAGVADLRARLEPYHTARSAGADSEAGLASVFAITEAHGGKVEVDTGLDGTGTTLRVVLPAAPRPVARPRVITADLPRGSGNVLVVDDDPMVRKVVAGSLASLGYTAIEAGSGGDAIAIYRQRHADIRGVVLDMMMNGMAGRATYLGLREINPRVAVLLMSGHTLNEQVQEILDLGVRSFVSKPYSIAQLATAMAELVRS